MAKGDEQGVGSWTSRLAMLGLTCLLSLLIGCKAVPAYEQELASKRPMTFDDTGADGFRNGLTAQVEPGAVGGRSNSGGGCTSCK